MKSLLQEASSVSKAIEKAWMNAGKPEEFTIKILKTENKSFLGIVKQPAIVSITYNPLKSTDISKKDVIQKKELSKHSTSSKKIEDNKKRVVQEALISKEKHIKENFDKKVSSGWTNEYVSNISGWLTELLKIMNIQTNFNTYIDKKILNVYLDKKTLKETEEEKLFFISLSSILMQFLKRKYKRKFSNYYLIINVATQAGNSKKQDFQQTESHGNDQQPNSNK